MNISFPGIDTKASMLYNMVNMLPEALIIAIFLLFVQSRETCYLNRNKKALINE